MLENYIATYLIDIAALIFLCFLIHNNNILDKNRKYPFYFGTALVILIIFSEGGTIITGGEGSGMRLLNIICNVLGFSLAPVIPIILVTIFDIKIIKTNKYLIMPSILNIIAVALSPWLGLIFYVDANNYYERGYLFFVFVAAYIINLTIFLVSAVQTGRKNHYPIKVKITALSLFAVTGTSIQLVAPDIYSSWHCVTLSLLLYYLLLSEFDGSLDTLTRLHNRASYESAVKKLTRKEPHSIIVLDVNNFKEINDTYGHDFGDTVLKTVASVIRKSFDNRCSCFRTGGDEFYIINSEIDTKKLEYQLKTMTSNLEKERQIESRLPTVAYGYSIFNGGKAMDFQRVLKEADDQMYYYKNIQKEQQKNLGAK